MARHLAIETAYARNQRDPLVLDIDDLSFTLDPTLDVGRLAVLFTRFQEGLTELADDNVPIAERIAKVAEKKQEGIEALTACLVEDDRGRFAEQVTPRVDVTVLSGIITWLLTEVSGQSTPTPPPSSSNGSSAGGQASTDGAPQGESTPSLSPSTEP